MADPTPRRKHLPIVGGTPAAPASAPADKPKKRLPVLQNTEEDEGDDRPPWHWAGIGAVAIFLVWLPLAALINTPVARLLRDAGEGAVAATDAPLRARILMVAFNAAAFAAAAFAGGFLVGRFGGRAGRREAAASGVVAAAVAWALSFAQAPKSETLVWALLLAAIAALGGGGAYLGGRVGLRVRGGVRR